MPKLLPKYTSARCWMPVSHGPTERVYFLLPQGFEAYQQMVGDGEYPVPCYGVTTNLRLARAWRKNEATYRPCDIWGGDYLASAAEYQLNTLELVDDRV